MPLSTPTVSRERLHLRRVTYEGFQRSDGLYDIDAHLADTKDRDFELLTGVRAAGEAVHDMHVRVTIDRAFTIHAIEARTDQMPYPGACDRIGPAYTRLVGANLVRGFRKQLHDTMGGVHGCTHLTELLGYLPTAAVQTFAGWSLVSLQMVAVIRFAEPPAPCAIALDLSFSAAAITPD